MFALPERCPSGVARPLELLRGVRVLRGAQVDQRLALGRLAAAGGQHRAHADLADVLALQVRKPCGRRVVPDEQHHAMVPMWFNSLRT